MSEIGDDSRSLQSRLTACLHPPRVGKVRDTYGLTRKRPHQPILFPVVSDRVSIFDFKLGPLIPGKGEVLNAFNIAAKLYRRRKLPDARDDLIAFGPDIDAFIPPQLQGNPELYRRATVVDQLVMEDRECVVRGYATGSFMKSYRQGERLYCGHVLPEGLIEGQELSQPLFTPTTKAKTGHDEPLDYHDVRGTHGLELEETSIQDYLLYRDHSLLAGIIGVDTKFEYGRRRHADGALGRLVLGDEAWTPDSSRFWDAQEYRASFPARLPSPMDKQALRHWGITMGIDALDPKNLDHVAMVLRMIPSSEVVENYLRQMHRAFEMMWGTSFTDFQRNSMRIR